MHSVVHYLLGMTNDQQLTAAATLIRKYRNALSVRDAARQATLNVNSESEAGFLAYQAEACSYASYDAWHEALEIFDLALGGTGRNMHLRLESRSDSDYRVAGDWIAGKLPEPLD